MGVGEGVQLAGRDAVHAVHVGEHVGAVPAVLAAHRAQGSAGVALGVVVPHVATQVTAGPELPPTVSTSVPRPARRPRRRRRRQHRRVGGVGGEGLPGVPSSRPA
ncbi:hypothetical protein E2C01_061700 [Portunus trituberculatus]|uniref:Uncharacterized protein n=1 Tax=Portunus trituberculatus TaxID=210409 RepID=A0A5B7HBP4_PORTR|nr:hypothetical protein [Portunus trituberculatus]